MVTEIGYLTLSVKDVGRAMPFYGGLFGWTFDHEPGSAYAHVGNTKLPLGLVEQGAADIRFIYFRVDDIAAMKRTLVRLGGHVLEEHEYPSGLNVVCSDDQGTVFSLWQPAAGF